MPWTQKQMLRDANGDLIPQYWDVAEQEFKPLTGSDGANDVRVTGSNVEYIELSFMDDIEEEIWVTLFEDIDISGFRKYQLSISGFGAGWSPNHSVIEVVTTNVKGSYGIGASSGVVLRRELSLSDSESGDPIIYTNVTPQPLFGRYLRVRVKHTREGSVANLRYRALNLLRGN